MRRLTVESNYSENTFVFPPEQRGTDFRVRIFGRSGEMPFAGHPAIGTAFALAHIGRIKPSTPTVGFGLGIGPTAMDLEWNGNDLAVAWMTQHPATGSAAGPLGCFMVRYGFVAADRAGSIVNAQGVLVKRPSRIHIRIASANGEITQVKVGGASVVVGEGTASV
jgi:predicted PhzF superfamily epimerase YddE/YHI9